MTQGNMPPGTTPHQVAFSPEMEKRLAILVSLSDLGGSGTKQDVLDNILASNYLLLNKRDLEWLPNRPELRWRNDLAFTRKHLVQEEYVDDSQHNVWQVTQLGRTYLESMTRALSKADHEKLKLLTLEAIERARQISSQAPHLGRTASVEVTVQSDLKALALEEQYFEGKKLARYSIFYERDPKLRAQAVAIHGTTCMVCGFDFFNRYGERGAGYIEVHHIHPISRLSKRTKIDPKSDMAVVCSNCHRMIHRSSSNVLSLAQLKLLVNSQAAP
jgi:predicted HNH restriction endonuclease